MKRGEDWTTDDMKTRGRLRGAKRNAELKDPRTAEEKRAAQELLALPPIRIGSP